MRIWRHSKKREEAEAEAKAETEQWFRRVIAETWEPEPSEPAVVGYRKAS
jgi:hypothetical protein